MFQEATENNDDLKFIFDDEQEDINIAANNWLSVVNHIIKASFNKIRIKKQRNSEELNSLFKEKEDLKKSLAVFENAGDTFNVTTAKENLEKTMEKIGDICAEKNKRLVQEHLGKDDNSIDGFNQAKTWALKKKLSPKNTLDPPAAKKDETGKLVTSKSQLEKLYLKTYQERLQPNIIKPSLKESEYLKEYLFEIRLQLAKHQSSKKWTLQDLNKALKSFKNNKARDAIGHTYELFKYGGTDLKLSLLKLFNLVNLVKFILKFFSYQIFPPYTRKKVKSPI